jgi:iron(III) transport system permease protein
MPPDNLDGLAMRPILNRPATPRTDMHGWIQRGLIALACLWLLVGVVLPLGEVLERATRIELPVAIEEPTEQEKTEDDFRGEISVAGFSILLLEADGQPQLFLNNQPAAITNNKAGTEDLDIQMEGSQVRKITVRTVPTGGPGNRRRHIAPLVISRHGDGRWLIDGKRLPMGERVRVVRRFIGIANFMDYFGIQGISQFQLLLSLALLIAAATLIIKLIVTHLQTGHDGRSPLASRLLAAVVLLLAAQALQAMRVIGCSGAGSTNLAQSAWNSLSVAFTATVIAVTLAFIYAYGLTRTCMRGKTAFRTIAMLPLFAPTMLYGLSLVYMFGNQGILTTGFFGKLPWLAHDISLYGFTGIVIAEIAFTFPPAMMILSVALQHTDARLYEAATALGAGPLRTFFTVTLPGVKYGLLSAVFVCFTLSFTDFGAPKVVGGHFNVLAVDIYKQVVGQQNFGMGATVSMILLVPTLLAFVADRIVQRRSHAALTARSVPLTPVPTHVRDGIFTLFCSLIALSILATLFTAGLASFVKIWPYAFTHPEIYPDIWTLSHYTFEHVGGGGMRAFVTSLRMSLYTAVFGTVITFISAWLIEKTRDAERLRQGAYLLSIVPLALPGLVIGIAYVFFFNKPVLNIPFTSLQFSNPFAWLYGTMAILVLSNIIHFYTVSFLTATTALRQLDKEFELVSESMAVPFYRTFFNVSVPVCFPAIIEIAAYYFVSSMATVSAVIFLYNSRLPLASVAVVNMDDAGDTAAAAAMCMLIVGVNVLVRAAAEGLCVLFARRTAAWRKK